MIGRQFIGDDRPARRPNGVQVAAAAVFGIDPFRRHDVGLRVTQERLALIRRVDLAVRCPPFDRRKRRCLARFKAIRSRPAGLRLARGDPPQRVFVFVSLHGDGRIFAAARLQQPQRFWLLGYFFRQDVLNGRVDSLRRAGLDRKRQR
jgi:hypothetical protein